MVKLNSKLRSATLMEAIVATVLVVVIFIVASLVLNNLLKSYHLGKTHDVEYRMNQLRYELCHERISLPHKEKFKDWVIEVRSESNTNYHYVVFDSRNEETAKTYTKRCILYGQD